MSQVSNGMLYFGCWAPNTAGHYFYWPGGRRASSEVQELPWMLKEVDGGLCPQIEIEPGRFMRDEPQSLAAMHYRDGWTSLALWDRTADKRGGANSAFFAPGELDFHTLERKALAWFPAVWTRINRAAPVRVHGTELVARSLDPKWYADGEGRPPRDFDKHALRNVR